MSASLCLILCPFHSSSPLLSLRPLFYLRWIVIMWSKRAPPSPLNEKEKKKKKKMGNKKQFCAYEKRKEKEGKKACVFPSSATLCPRFNKLLTCREKCSRIAVTRPGELRRGRPAPGASDRGASERHSGDFCPAVESRTSGPASVWRECLFWRVCAQIMREDEQAQRSSTATLIENYILNEKCQLM